MGGKKKHQEGRGSMSLDEAMADLASRFVVNCPSEEQESIKRCMWQVEAAHWFYDDVYRKHHRDLPFMNFKDFTMAFFNECPAMMNEEEESITRSLNLFQKYKRRVPVCGAIMLNAEMTKAVLVKAWGKCSAWSFPKGKINQEETKIECAVREVEEETGYNCSQHMNPQDYIELSIRQQVIRLYIATGVPEDTHFETQTRKEIGDIQWIPLDGLRNGSVNWSGKKKNQNVDESFFTGGPFLAPLTEWIESHALPKSATKSLKNKSRVNTPLTTSESDGCAGPSSDSDSSAKKSRKKKQQTRTENHSNKLTPAKTFGSNSGGGWSVDEMFAVNEAKFGIVNSYDESLYTTKLPEVYVQQKAVASGRKQQKARRRSQQTSAPCASLQPQPNNAVPANALIYSGDTPPSCNSTYLMPTTARCADQKCGAPLSSTPQAAPTLLDFSFNRDEILSCF
jgi:8-oxo-dGTP pyrophosphatase MutT (NUDIX family)